jgi:uncharacterized protein RhaS with RHS repeats
VAAFAQVLQFSGGTSPAIQATTAQGVAASGLPAQLMDDTGRAFAAIYDNYGRLSALKKASGRNIADMLVGYDSNGRIQRVRFDNGYQLVFHYRSDGTEEVTDPLGGRLVRANMGGSALVTQTLSDPSGFLAETLKRVETLFAHIQPVPGLNPPPATSSSQ